jgi:benzoate-CoA ligase family protein
VSAEIPEALNLADHYLHARVREGRGERTALICGEARLTYRDVQRLAHRFAHVLRGLGVQPEQRVIVSLPDGPEFVGALFGILEMGAVLVMVNPGQRAEDIAYFCEYTRARVAVVGEEAWEKFAAVAHGPRLLLAGARAPGHASFEDEAARVPDDGDVFPAHRDDAAIWLFSGGTTGRPKAVVQTHASFVNTTELYAHNVLAYSENDRTLSVPKLYFGYATGSNLFFPFSAGGTSILFPERVTADVLFDQIRRHRPTILINVPTMVNQMVSHPDAARQDLSCLRFATSAGEALPVELHRRWKDTFGVELLDGLGTAEMWHVFLTNRPGDVRPGTLGKPVAGFDVRVCDDDGRDVPDGEVGALWVGGDSRAIGYWHAMDKSMAAFRGRWYVTGDLVSRDADGYFHYGGRADDMLKVGGKWLAPGELENCLLGHPEVRECAVVGVKDAAGLVKPRAYVVARAPRAGLDEDLKAYVRQNLEPYKYPREVVFVDALPRTHLGKVDRGKLRGP